MASFGAGRSLLDRIDKPTTSEQWPHDLEVAESSFKAGQRRPKRKKEPEVDSDHLYTPWTDGIKVTGDETKERRLHNEILAMAVYLQPTRQEREARRKVYDFVKAIIQKRFPRSEVSLFGSVAHDLCLPDGDLDVVVRLPGVDAQVDKKRTLFQLSAALRYSGVTNNVQVIGHARVPVASFQTGADYGSLNFDFGINNVDGFEAVKVINSYLTKMPALRPLIFVLKGFLRQRKLHSAASSGLSSYAVICMTISFLQLNPAGRPLEHIDNPLNTGSLGILLLDFLHYYGTTFPYEDSYISVNEQQLLPKESASWINDHGHRGRLVVQCLINPENDIARAAGKIEQVKTAFQKAHETLSSFHFTTPHTNILGDNNIVRLTQKTIDQRDHLVDLVNSGRLLTLPTTPQRQDHQHQRPYLASRPRQHQLQPRYNHVPYSDYGNAASSSGRENLRNGSYQEQQANTTYAYSNSGRGNRYHSGSNDPPPKRRRH